MLERSNRFCQRSAADSEGTLASAFTHDLATLPLYHPSSGKKLPAGAPIITIEVELSDREGTAPILPEA